MAPATRRSSGLGGGGSANVTTNLDHILEHFNQFKRKHITQNRDIIKTNALAQLRIKELEDKVLAMEAERTQREGKLIAAQRQLQSAQQAILCVRQGWQLVGTGMAKLSGQEGFEAVFQDSEASQGVTMAQRARSAMASLQDTHIPPSTRIVLDPNVLPGGVVRNVSRPPEADLVDVAEEAEERTMEQTPEDVDGALTYGDGSMVQMQMTYGGEGEDTTRHDEETERMGNDGTDHISFATDAEETIRMAGDNSSQAHDQTGLESSMGDMAIARSVLPTVPAAHPLRHMTSADSLSSFADEEEIEFSTDDEKSIAVVHQTFTKANKGMAGSARHKTSEDRNAQSNAEAGPSTVLPRDLMVQSEAETEDEDTDMDEDLSHLNVRASRRSSMRDRKSINYALPKLNTKMRKPDPVDLVPAKKSERKKSHAPSGQAEANGVGQDGTSSHTVDGDVEEEMPQKRKLKGKQGVASCGNLREIRQLHQRKTEQEALDALQEGSGSAVRATMASPPEDRERDTVTAPHSPQRRSSRKSLRRRSSSSISGDGHGEGEAAGYQGVATTTATQSNDYSLPGPSLQSTVSHPTYESHRAPAVGRSSYDPQATPRVRPNGLTDLSTSSSMRMLASTAAGTPIPKATIRMGQQGTIKALNKAANRAPLGQGLPPTQPQRLSNSMTSAHGKVLTASSKANSHARSASGSSMTGSLAMGMAGDPTKRNNSSNGLMTHDVFSSVPSGQVGTRYDAR